MKRNSLMNVQFINPFLEATIEVLKNNGNDGTGSRQALSQKGNQAKGDVSGIIGMTGSAQRIIGLELQRKKAFSRSFLICSVKITRRSTMMSGMR